MKDITTEELQAMSVSLGLASRLIQCEPDQEWVQQCIDLRMFEAAPFGEEDQAVADGLALMDTWCLEAQDNVEEATADIRREWLRLFVGCGIPEASILESYYVQTNSTMFAKNTIEVRKAYKRWGLEFERKASEPDDALGLMLAFCATLLQAQAQARVDGNQELEEKAAQEFEDFLAGHMLPWVSAWRFLVKQHAATSYYRGMGELVFGLERACAGKLGIGFKEEDGTFAYKK